MLPITTNFPIEGEERLCCGTIVRQQSFTLKESIQMLNRYLFIHYSFFAIYASFLHHGINSIINVNVTIYCITT